MDDLDWRMRGSCTQHNPDWWTPTDVNSPEAEAAVNICRACPVQRQCGDWASANTKLCSGAIYGGIYYTAGGGTDRTIRESRIQPAVKTRAPRKARVGWGQMPIDLIRDLAALGCTDRQIAAVVGTSPDSISTTRHNRGIPGGKTVRMREEVPA